MLIAAFTSRSATIPQAMHRYRSEAPGSFRAPHPWQSCDVCLESTSTYSRPAHACTGAVIAEATQTVCKLSGSGAIGCLGAFKAAQAAAETPAITSAAPPSSCPIPVQREPGPGAAPAPCWSPKPSGSGAPARSAPSAPAAPRRALPVLCHPPPGLGQHVRGQLRDPRLRQDRKPVVATTSGKSSCAAGRCKCRSRKTSRSLSASRKEPTV